MPGADSGTVLHGAQHASALGGAVRLACLSAANAAGGPIAARLERRTSARVPLLLGLALAAAGTLAPTEVTPATGVVAVAAALATVGFGAARR
jgi:hypothetical protein